MALLASHASIEAALEPMKLFECIGKRGCDVGSRFAVQTLGLVRRRPLRQRNVGLTTAGRAQPVGQARRPRRAQTQKEEGQTGTQKC